MEDALTLAESMDARGHGRGRRTRYRPQVWSPIALFTTATASLAAAVYVWAAVGGWAQLDPPVAPLGWPEVDPWLLCTAVLLAVPGVSPESDR
jgi:energy-coupling factor transport system permease protein